MNCFVLLSMMVLMFRDEPCLWGVGMQFLLLLLCNTVRQFGESLASTPYDFILCFLSSYLIMASGKDREDPLGKTLGFFLYVYGSFRLMATTAIILVYLVKRYIDEAIADIITNETIKRAEIQIGLHARLSAIREENHRLSAEAEKLRDSISHYKGRLPPRKSFI